MVVKDIAVLIAWILFVSRLECKRSVDQVKIQIVELESRETRFECRSDALGPVSGVPPFVVTKMSSHDSCSGESCMQCLTHFALIPISLGTIEVSKPGFQCVFGRSMVNAPSESGCQNRVRESGRCRD